MNSYFAEQLSNIRVENKSNPSFYDYISWINGFDNCEKRPALISIFGDDWTSGHTMVALSTYSTAYSNQSKYNDYLGVHNTWTEWNGVSSSNAVGAIRYINYDELISAPGVTRVGTYFNNVRSIDCINSFTISDGFTVKCSLPYGTKYVKFPTWTVENGQDDIIWYDGVVNNRKGQVSINIENHNMEAGVYYTHVYAYDQNMNLLSMYGTIQTTIERKIDEIDINSINDEGFTVMCNLPVGTKYVKFPTWTAANGQDDIVWYDAAIYPTRALRRIYYSDHNNEKGLYYVHIYAYDKNMNILCKATTSVVIN